MIALTRARTLDAPLTMSCGVGSTAAATGPRHAVRRRLPLALLCALACFSATAASASAAQRYVSSAGSGSTCSVALPCDLHSGVALASAGDEVIVNPGSYATSVSTVGPVGALNVHGVAGSPRPQIDIAVGGGSAGLYLGDGSSISHLALTGSLHDESVIATRSPATGFLTINDVQISITAPYVNGLWTAGGALITNTVVYSTQAGDINASANYNAGTTTLRNDTLIAIDPGGIAFEANGNNAAQTVDANSVIFRGGSPVSAGADIELDTNTNAVTVNVANSDYRPTSTNLSPSGTGTAALNNLGGNIAAAPVFANPTGDFHELASSPTIDTGATDASSPATDADGNPRVVGPAVDMGAYEFQGAAPLVSTGATSGQTSESATVAGTVSAQDQLTTYHLDYGPTAAYGSSTGAQRLTTTDMNSYPASVGLTNLLPSSTYHYRVTAVNSAGTGYGADQAFTTSAAPTPVTPPAQPAQPAVVAPLAVLSSHGQPGVQGNTLTTGVTASCPANASGPCKVQAAAYARVTVVSKHGHAKTRLVALGKLSVSIAPGASTALTATLNANSRKLLAKQGKSAAVVLNITVGEGGAARTTTHAFTLKAAAARHHKKR